MEFVFLFIKLYVPVIGWIPNKLPYIRQSSFVQENRAVSIFKSRVLAC